MGDTHPEKAYWDDVRDAATEIAGWVGEDAGGDAVDTREELMDRIHHYIDGHGRVIYTHLAQECLRYSPNDGRALEEFGADGAVTDGCLNWSFLAFFAFEADVYEQLDALGVDVNAPFACPACDATHEERDDARDCCWEPDDA